MSLRREVCVQCEMILNRNEKMLVLKGELVRNGENILLSLFKIMIKEMCLLF